MSEQIIINPVEDDGGLRGLRWNPVARDQAVALLDRSGLDVDSRREVLRSAATILGRGVPPSEADGVATGLVVGYVQSGKTLSFTTVIALARDNGFPLVIVVAGTKDNLLSQSTERLARDLDVESAMGAPAWRLIKNPRDENLQTIRQTIEDWKDAELDEDERRTLILTVLKQKDRLASLTRVLNGVDLSSVPVLIVDDEADQASLNTKVRQGGESSTYECLKDLRGAIPHHTYLQYTATPQAPLLINIADTLSPDFVEVLKVGPGYVGGREFFAKRSAYVKVIPATEIAPDDALPTDPPTSLLAALRVFFVGLSASLIHGRAGGPSRRSMLVHPSRARAVHRSSQQWISSAIEEWQAILKLPETDQDRKDLTADFRRAYDDLAITASDIPQFQELMDRLPRALRRTQVIEFNTNGRPKTPEIQWRDADGWILVGGQAVDRGFTVDSLSVTYMPRGVGTGNADSIQQRARFFGYKRRYLGYCRIYLESAARAAFEDYVEHEEIMRLQLEEVAASGESLKAWKRRFILDPNLNPCRSSVIRVSDPLFRGTASQAWIQQRGALLTDELRQHNRGALHRFLNGLEFKADDTYPSAQAAQRHQVCSTVPVGRLIDLLVDYRFEEGRDTAAFTLLLLELGETVRRSANSEIVVYKMRPSVTADRTISAAGLLPKGFLQGRTELKDGIVAYPGDAFFKSPDKITVQAHAYDLKRDKEIVARSAPLLAVHVPTTAARSWLLQHQNAQQA